MASSKIITLVTGGNSGVGFELAAQLLAKPSQHVLLGCRSAEKGKAAVEDLSSRNLPGTIELLPIDVANEESISAAAKEVEAKHGRIDALVNNAALGWPEGAVGSQLDQTFRTNATGPFLTSEAFVPLLKKSTGTPRIINVSSGAGLISNVVNPKSANYTWGFTGLPYCVSKAALNFITVTQAKVYGEQGIKVFGYTPAFVVSNLGPFNKAENGAKPASTGSAPIVEILDGAKDDHHGEFLKTEGIYGWA